MVGACVVRRGRLVGEGYHRFYGGAHAEILALKNAAGKTRGATLYVSLEPCATWGKTPPCVSEIVRAGVRRVVVGALDPNPKNHGRGIRVLKRLRISVTAGVLAEEALKRNEAFVKWVKKRMPFVTLKMAQSLDGKIATRTGRSRGISSPAARRFVRRLRGEQDAILIGKNTLLADNPKLSPPLTGMRPLPGKPWRIALDPDSEVSAGARIFQGKQLTLIAVSEKKAKDRLSRRKGLTLILVPEKKGRLDLKNLLRQLASLGVAKLLVEGGGETAWSLLSQGLVDKAYWIVAPKIIGGRSAKTSVEGKGVRLPQEAMGCRPVKISRLGEDLLLESAF